MEGLNDVRKRLITYGILGTLFQERIMMRRMALQSAWRMRDDLVKARTHVKNGKFDDAAKILSPIVESISVELPKLGDGDSPVGKFLSSIVVCMDKTLERNRSAAFSLLTSSIAMAEGLAETIRGQDED